MVVHFAHSILEYPEDRWDALAGDELGLTHRWQRAMERCRRNYRPRYVLIEDRQGPLAAAIMDTSAPFGRTGWREALLGRSTLVLGAPFSSLHCGVALRTGLTHGEALPALERALGAVCLRERRPLLCVSSVLDADLSSWRARGFRASPQSPGMVLDLTTSSYEAYSAGLLTKDRTDLRRMWRRGEALAVTITHGPPAGDRHQLYALLCEVYARHGTPAEALPFTPDLLDTLERELPGELIYFRGSVQGTLAGFGLCIKVGTRLWWPLIGLRYDLARPSYLYFLMFDEVIRWSIQHGVRRIYAGLTKEREKQKHGFQRQERWFCYRVAPRPVNNLLTVALPLAQRLIGGTASSPAAPPLAAGK
jgi:predicted N-acyltransferase